MARYFGHKRPKNTKKTLLQMLSYLGRHKLQLALVAVLVLISAGASILGTYLVKPVINTYILPGNLSGLVKVIAGMAVLYAAGALSCFGYNQLMVHVSQQVVSEIRNDLFEKTQKLPLSFFDAHTHGELMSRFTNDVDTISEALNNSFTLLIQSFVTVTGTLIMLFLLDLRLSVIVIFFLSMMMLFIRWNGKRSRRYFDEQQKYLGEINGFVEEMMAGQKVEKVFNHEAADFQEFCRRNEALRVSSTKALSHSAMNIPVIVSLSYFNYAVSACVGGLFALAGLTDLGTLASYLIYVRQSAMPMNQFTQQINFLLAALSGAERIFEVMEQEPEVDDGDVTLCHVKTDSTGALTESSDLSDPLAWKMPGITGNASYTLLKGDVRFHNVHFSYVPGCPILKDISLFAHPGQKIAFVGSTGAGKTTIINLVNRFYELDSGSITYDGIDLTRIKKDDLRRSLSMVIQDTHLFTGTIADNIRYGRLDATDEEIREAARIANADSFIRRLPKGYDTMLDNDGASLSQGQRQLLSIARAAISRPPVLILDEATSSIDTRTEKLIQKGMDSLMEGRTTFVIAHRLSTVRGAKAILVLEQGTVLERGSHEELLNLKKRYYQLYTGQYELQ